MVSYFPTKNRSYVFIAENNRLYDRFWFGTEIHVFIDTAFSHFKQNYQKLAS